MMFHYKSLKIKTAWIKPPPPTHSIQLLHLNKSNFKQQSKNCDTKFPFNIKQFRYWCRSKTDIWTLEKEYTVTENRQTAWCWLVGVDSSCLLRLFMKNHDHAIELSCILNRNIGTFIWKNLKRKIFYFPCRCYVFLFFIILTKCFWIQNAILQNNFSDGKFLKLRALCFFQMKNTSPTIHIISLYFPYH